MSRFCRPLQGLQIILSSRDPTAYAVGYILSPPTSACLIAYCLLFLHLAKQPSLRHAPVAFDGDGADAEHLGRLFDREAAEVAQLDDARFLRVNLGQCLQRVVQCDQFRAALERSVYVLVERELLVIVPAFL